MARTRAGGDYELGRWLLVAERQRVWERLGHSSFDEYVSRLFGLTHREWYERARVARELESLPALTDALEKGSLCWSAVRELTRVATAHTEKEWMAAAERKSVRQIQRMTTGKQRGDRPDDSCSASCEASPPSGLGLRLLKTGF